MRMVDVTTTLSTLQDFHFVRPWWLLALIPGISLGWAMKYRQQWGSPWLTLIDPQLLPPLLQGNVTQASKLLPFSIILFWILSVFALAGPAWEKLPQPVQKIDNALVILLDLSPSMLASDIKPARLVAARHKIIDLLKARTEGYSALIAYSGDAHVVAPLTDDNKTIINLVNVLEPAIMPIEGSNLEHALLKAFQLFENSGYNTGDILLLTDGVTKEASQQSSELLATKSYVLSIIGIGTEAGAPIPSIRGGFIKDNQDNIVMPALDSNTLQNLANQVNGRYTTLQLSDADIAPLIRGTQRLDQQKTTTIEREFDQWQDMGALLTWPLLVLLLLAFRSGLLFGFIIAIPLLHTPTAKADETVWEKLWLNDNQRAMKAMQQQDYETAEKTFRDADWRAAAQYQNRHYADSLKHFEKDNTAAGYYNSGNAMAKAGQLTNAISAYDQALSLKPGFEDAIINRELTKKALEKQLSKQNNSNKNPGNRSGNEETSDQGSEICQPGDDNCHKNNGDSSEKNDTSPMDKENANKQSASERNNGEERSPEEKKNEQQAHKNPPKENPSTSEASGAISSSPTTGTEEKQAMEQWLRKVPDDPSILLRNKFQYYYQQQLQNQQQGNIASHLNHEERW